MADIIGSVGRVEDFDGCFRARGAKLRTAIAERAANPGVIDMPISLLQVDHGYFVEDGHKRLSMSIAAGRRFVEADVDRFQTDLHLAPGTTMASIRATAQERRFRRVTGLDKALPRRRFALSDPAGYLELQESVKAHTLDYSRSIDRLVLPEDAQMGLAPPRAAKAASERTRPWCEYAARMIGAVTGRNQPAHISLDTAVTTKTRQHPRHHDRRV